MRIKVEFFIEITYWNLIKLGELYIVRLTQAQIFL
jgi:hypothetical protein